MKSSSIQSIALQPTRWQPINSSRSAGCRPAGSRNSDIRYTAGVIALFLATAYLGFVHLGHTFFWDDESHISIIAKNFLTTGQFSGWDGRNLLAYDNGNALEPGLRHIIPQLDAPTMAASYYLFGVSEWAGRLPFVIAGLIGLALFPLLLRHDFGEAVAVRFYAFASLALSAQFILYIRTCRSYSLSFLFSMLVFYCYRRCLETQRGYFFSLLCLASILLFFANFLIGTSFLLALAAVHWTFHRHDLQGAGRAKAIAAGAVFVLVAAGYVVANRVWAVPKMHVPEPWYVRKPILLWWNLRELNTVCCLPWTIGLALALILFHRQRPRPPVRQTPNSDMLASGTGRLGTGEQERPRGAYEGQDWERVTAAAREWGAMLLWYVFFLAMLAGTPVSKTQIAEVRYLLPPLFLGAGLTGVFLAWVHRRTMVFAFASFLILINCNLFSIFPDQWLFRLLLPSLIWEVHHPYPTNYSAVVDYLRRNARRDDLVFASPEYMNYPIMFYLGDQIKICCTIDPQTTYLPRATLRELHAPVFRNKNFPDWMVLFGWGWWSQAQHRYFTRIHREDGRMVCYPYHRVKVLDVYWNQTHRPELPWHSFGPYTDFNRSTEGIYIFRRGLARVVNQAPHKLLPSQIAAG